LRLRIRTAYDPKTIPNGASIACNGVCLTVVDTGADWFGVDVSRETVARTTLDESVAGRRINLERALKMGDELGGHLVSGDGEGGGRRVPGRVGGVATMEKIRREDGSRRLMLPAPADLMRFIAPKGSVALDGVSLTVNAVQGNTFGINVIPHTNAVTTFGA